MTEPQRNVWSLPGYSFGRYRHLLLTSKLDTATCGMRTGFCDKSQSAMRSESSSSGQPRLKNAPTGAQHKLIKTKALKVTEPQRNVWSLPGYSFGRYRHLLLTSKLDTATCGMRTGFCDKSQSAMRSESSSSGQPRLKNAPTGAHHKLIKTKAPKVSLRGCLELLPGFGPGTSSLPRMCSTS